MSGPLQFGQSETPGFSALATSRSAAAAYSTALSACATANSALTWASSGSIGLVGINRLLDLVHVANADRHLSVVIEFDLWIDPDFESKRSRAFAEVVILTQLVESTGLFVWHHREGEH